MIGTQKRAVFLNNIATSFKPIPQYKDVLDATLAWGGTLPSLPIQIWHNKILKDAIDDGKWAVTRYFIALQHDAPTYHYGMVDWKNPFGAKGTPVNNPTFRSGIGFKSNGTSSHIITEYNPFLDSALQGNNCSYFFFGDDDFSNNGALFGGADASDMQLWLYNFPTTNNWNCRLSNSAIRSANNIVKTANFNAISYNGSNVIISIGNQDYTFPQTSTFPKPNVKLALLGRNVSGAVDARTLKTAAYFGAGDSTVAAYFKAKLEVAFAAIRPPYAPYQLIGDCNPDDLSKMWQDAAKTIPAADGQPVKVVSTGTWGDLVASADTDRPILTANGLNGKRTLLYDGNDDNFDVPEISGDMCLIFVFRNTNSVNGSQIMSGNKYITVTGSSYSGNTSFGGKEYIIAHPSDGSSTAGVPLKNANNFNTFVFTRQGNICQDINGWGITGRSINNSPMTLNKMGDPFNPLWQVKGPLARVLLYQGCPPDNKIESDIFNMNAIYNI